MLAASNIDVVPVLRQFKEMGISVGLLVPTKTGLSKSILDATEQIRENLASSQAHEFSNQLQGPENKRILPTKLVSRGQIVDTKTSLYRPLTKGGDPRLWIYGLKRHAQPTDLLAIFYNRPYLVVVNCSKSDLRSILSPANYVFQDLFSGAAFSASTAAKELLDKLRDIGRRGFIPTMRPGDTGVGFTLESLLGIAANSSKSPDYKGIELKSGRSRSHKSGRATLFSKVPNWRISRLKSSKDILFTRGRYNAEADRIQLYHQLSATKPNSYGLQLLVGKPPEYLHQIYVADSHMETDVSWDMGGLQDALEKKHQETFWVHAQSEGRSGDYDERYWYTDVKHTGKIDRSAFPILLELGVVTLDYLIKQLPNKISVKDKGYLFKMSTSDLDLLFTSVNNYDLTE